MMKKIYFNLLFISCSFAQAMEIIPVVKDKVTKPCSIVYISPTCIAIGGNNGILLVDDKGNLVSEKHITKNRVLNDSTGSNLNGSIYQIIRGTPNRRDPRNVDFWYAIDNLSTHTIETYSNSIVRSDQKDHSFYFYFNTDEITLLPYDPYLKEATPKVLLHPYDEKKISDEFFLNKQYLALAINQYGILALLLKTTKKNVIETNVIETNVIKLWNNMFDSPQLWCTIPLNQLDKNETLFSMDEKKGQRLAFSPDGLSIAVALQNNSFIIPIHRLYQKDICLLLLLCKNIRNIE